MASIYICQVTGDGLTTATAFKPLITPADAPFAVLMLDERKNKSRALIGSSHDTLTGPGLSRLLTAASWPALVTLAKSTNPTAAQRNSMNTWLTNAAYLPLTSSQVSWFDCIQYAARQVNPAADLAATNC